VLGSQPLTALRDRIYCLQDHTLDGPHTPSACFFIENKFYNDLRDRRAISYSETIVEWVKAESRAQHPGLALFDQLDMHTTTFNQLSIRLGSHYQYMHQGDCTHTIIFTQMRMAHAEDVQNARAYPLKPFQARTKRKKCRVCDLYPAAYVTYGDKLANENPFFYWSVRAAASPPA
jgi:snRNA-activating protein complex subunit 3